MTAHLLRDALKRAESWPEYAQAQLASIVAEIDAEVHAGVYHATPEELAGIDAGIADAQAGNFVTEADIAALIDQHRPR